MAGGTGIADTLALQGGTVTLGAASSLTQTAGTLALTGPGTLEDDGSLVVAGGTLRCLGRDGRHRRSHAGARRVAAELGLLGGGLTVTVEAGATLDVGTLGGNAVVSVDAGAWVTIKAMAGAPTLSFAGSSAFVVLPGTGALPVTLQNLVAGDQIDFVTVSSNPGQGVRRTAARPRRAARST